MKASQKVSQRRNPVLLLHGLTGNEAVFYPLELFLEVSGWGEVYSFTFSRSWGEVPIEALARETAEFLDRSPLAGRTIDIVGYSMGGLVAREFIQNMGGTERVERFVSVSTPHFGTYLAFALLTPGVEQMRPNSQFLNALNGSVSLLSQVKVTSIFTEHDEIVQPYRNAILPIGRVIGVPVFGHCMMVLHPWSLQAIAKGLMT
jgi:triacylglycerol lipase